MTTQNNQVSASIIFLLPVILIGTMLLVILGVAVKTVKLLMTNREFRDTVMQLSTSTQNLVESIIPQRFSL